MKKSIAFLFLLVTIAASCLSSAFAAGGALSDASSPLHVIRTEYFDIIFPEECRATAEKIEAVCDDYYLEITALLETDAYQRFPVTITHSVELLNAYYAAIPYNRIVLYDTLPETSLDMYEDTIQSIFYHELTHAVTYNMKAKSLRKLSFISDSMNPAWLSLTSFWAEGATVSLESKGRGGRLNDPFSTQLVNQSLIEDKFPGWRDVTGARDTYPGGNDAYIFGAMFSAYLQDTYGMSKYADFWKKAGSSLTVSFVAGVFKKTYGMSVGDAWDEFEKTLPLPTVQKLKSALSDKKSRVETFDVFVDETHGETKIAYFDSAASSLRLVTLDADGKIKKNKKLLAITGIHRIAFSPDGTSLALSRLIDKKNYKFVTAEYNLKKKKFTQHKTTGRWNAYYTTASDGSARFSEIPIYPDKVSDAERTYFYGGEEIVYSPIGIDEHLNAAIIKNGLSWSLRLFDDSHVLGDYSFSAITAQDGASRNLIVHNLHAALVTQDSLWLSFTWAELGQGGKMLSRAGMVKIDRASQNATAFLQKENAFAGLTDAVPSHAFISALDGGTAFDAEQLVFYAISANYEENPLLRIQFEPGDFESVALSLSEVAPFDEKKPAVSTAHAELSYNPFRYYKNGIFVPIFGALPVYNHELTPDSNLGLGFSFVSTNPWGDRQFFASLGYNPIWNLYGAYISVGTNPLIDIGASGDDRFQYKLSASCVFEDDAFMQTLESISLTDILWRGKVSYFALGTQGLFLYGKQIIDDDLGKDRDESVGTSADGIVFAQFSNIHKIAPDVYDSAGYLLQPFVLTSYRDTEHMSEDDTYLNAGVTAQLRFPIIVPFIFTASLFPTNEYAASGSVQAILAHFEIHKGIPALSLFMQRVVISASYSGKLAYEHGDFWDIKRTRDILGDARLSDYSDEFRLAGDLYISPNTGNAARGEVQYSIGYALIYRPNPAEDEKRMLYTMTVGVNF